MFIGFGAELVIILILLVVIIVAVVLIIKAVLRRAGGAIQSRDDRIINTVFDRIKEDPSASSRP